jgi:hypothetical protein
MIEKAEKKKLREELKKLEDEEVVVGGYINKLAAYINSAEFEELKGVERGLVFAQSYSMFTYSNILHTRIIRILDRLMEQ